MDASEEYIKELCRSTINLYKLCFEEMGYDLGPTINKIDYHNFLVDDPISMTNIGDNENYMTDCDLAMGFKSGKAGETGLSTGMLNFICKYETGHSFGYKMTPKDLNGYDLKDANGHLTYGYGLLYHPTTQKFMDQMKRSWSQKELEELFLLHAKQVSSRIDKWASNANITLEQNQKDAIASGCYNFGLGFLNKNICKMIAKNPNDPAIKSTWEHLSDIQGKKYPGLIRRRKAEANWYCGQYNE